MNDHGYVLFVVVIIRSVPYHRDCNKSNMTDATSGAETATLPEHPSSPPIFSGVRVTVYCFVDHCLSFYHCILCPSLIYDM